VFGGAIVGWNVVVVADKDKEVDGEVCVSASDLGVVVDMASNEFVVVLPPGRG